MIVIADSGSTKTDWVVINEKYEEVFRTRTMGYNPYFVSSEDIENDLLKNSDLLNIVGKVKNVFFYGAGCSAPYLKDIVKIGINAFFKNAEVVVDHDLLAACYAVYRGEPAMVCILGTGSNSCFFDGKSVREETYSLAYILGDEGSGNNLGKKVVQAYFNKKMPADLAAAFDERYNLSIEELNRNVYQNKLANAYLATFSIFVHDHITEPFIQQLVYESMREFLENQVLPYKECRTAEINFIGSVAHYYEGIIRAAAAKLHLNIGHIVRRPIDNLIQYHIDYILPKITA